MNASAVKQVFLEKGMQYLYHANTVVTSLTYINNGGLMSRAEVERRGLPQTPQGTDESDKRFGVFDDVFFDSVDIHKQSRNINYYGAVMFVYGLEVLNELQGVETNVTKQNPESWNGEMIETDKYFENVESLQRGFCVGTFGQEITIRHPGIIGFAHLKKIILEYPGENRRKYFDIAKRAIENALDTNKIKIGLNIRHCSVECRCLEIYEKSKEGFACIFRLHPATCTVFFCHLAEQNPPPCRGCLPLHRWCKGSARSLRSGKALASKVQLVNQSS